ncbi:porin [Verrucomicrobium spinosum]|uniref:porin n=1 Tax=Verrucomicrobium spinosum TaxID=2736 RepID=UPI0001744DB9|nr:porin [Verrucomicrobium spinosum]
MKLKTSLFLLTAGLLSSAHAGEVMVASGKGVEPAVQPAGSEKSIYDKIWGLATLYKSDDNPVLQEFALQGRLQLQWADGSSDQGDYGTADRPDEVLWGDLEVRRWRLGFKSKWFRQFKLEGQIDVSPNWDPEFYGKIYDLNLTWTPSEAFNIGIGKYKANFFSVEQATSSKEILTFERALLSNTLFTGELTGARVNGKIDNLIYTAGVYAGDDQREFTEFDAGVVYQAGIGYDLTSVTGFDKTIVKFDYQYSDDAANAGGGANYEHAFSFNSTWEKGRFGLFTDVLGGTGRGSVSDVWGFHVIPSYFIADGLQLVARYQYASGDNDGLRLQSRYERLASDLTDGGRGDEYQAVYLGLNYYLYGHKLKLMAGTEYHNMSGGGDGGDFDGWTTLVGLRMFF